MKKRYNLYLEESYVNFLRDHDMNISQLVNKVLSSYVYNYGNSEDEVVMKLRELKKEIDEKTVELRSLEKQILAFAEDDDDG